MADEQRTFPCPKCGNLLLQDGTMNIMGVEYPFFGCDDCTITVNGVELPLGFCVNGDGVAIDPGTLGAPLKLEL